MAALTLVTLLSACAKGPPRDPDDACEIFRDRDDWWEAARDSHRQWGVPEATRMRWLPRSAM